MRSIIRWLVSKLKKNNIDSSSVFNVPAVQDSMKINGENQFIHKKQLSIFSWFDINEIKILLGFLFFLSFAVMFLFFDTKYNSEYWQYSINVLAIVFFLMSHISLKSSYLKVGLKCICIYSILIINRFEILKKLYDFRIYLSDRKNTEIIMYTIIAAIIAVLLYYLYKYRKVAKAAIKKGLFSVYRLLKNSIYYSKKARYFYLCTASIVSVILLYKNVFTSWNYYQILAALFFGMSIAVIIGLLLNEKLGNVRKHPFLMTLTGWGIIIISYLYYIRYHIKLDTIYITTTTATVLIILSAIWVFVVFIICNNANNKIMLLGIYFEIFCFISILCIQINEFYPEYTKRLVSSMIAALPIIYLLVLILFYAIKDKLINIWNKYIKPNFLGSILIGIVLLWASVFEIICIIRFNIFENKQVFLDALMECGAYIAIALLGVTILLGIAFIIYLIIVNSIHILRSKKQRRIDTTFLIYFSILMIILLGTIFFNHDHNLLVDINERLKSAESSFETSFKILAFIYTIMIISYIVMFLFMESISSNVVNECKYYLRNEDVAHRLYKHFVTHDSREKYFKTLHKVYSKNNIQFNNLCGNVKEIKKYSRQISSNTNDVLDEYKKLKNSLNIAENNEIHDAIKETLNNANSLENLVGDISNDITSLCYNSKMPKSMSDVLALYIAIFVFEIRDFCVESIRDILGVLSSDGLVTGAIKDLLQLFAGKNK